MDKITAKHIKLALLEYFRFKRQRLCATECLNADVVAFEDNVVHEVEVKISKSDLWKGEAKKCKHSQFGDGNLHKRWYLPNKFSLAVPEELLEEAKKWVNKTNKKYGIYLYYKSGDVATMKTAKLLSEHINEDWKDTIMKRVVSENINYMQKELDSKK